MRRWPLSSLRLLETHRRAIGGILSGLLFANVLVAIRHIPSTPENRAAVNAPGSPEGSSGTNPSTPGANVKPGAPSVSVASAARGPGKRGPGGLIGKYVPGVGTIPRGITGNKIRVVYYWKGDQVMGNSQYLNQTGRQGDLDEGEAFRNLVKYVNAHPNGDASFMGFKFNLHGRKLEPYVVETGKSDWSAEAFSEATANILAFDPFSTVSSHGSLSVDICPRLAQRGIHNFGTYDLGGRGGNLLQRTRGYCYGQATSFEAQIEHTVAYLAKQATTQYRDPRTGVTSDRKYGFLYARYTGLKDVVSGIVARLRRAGLNIPAGAVQSVSPSLTDSQAEAPGVIYAFQTAGVNTIIAPDAGAPLNVTHAATPQQYYPDWYVWPCSGQDAIGMVRLYDTEQWAHASGLTCYDPEFNSDLTNSDMARDTEWYQQYQSVAPGNEPPAPTPLVYQSLLPLLVGLTNAGREVTVEKFRAGIARFRSYRYSALSGVTTARKYMLVTIGSPDGSLVGDVARVSWDRNAPNSGGIRGNYVYPPPAVRYTRGAVY